jgi:menaquinone-dependent protoporphyrinogen oxidase
MVHKILVAYASRTGSTAGVAETIGMTLAMKQGAYCDQAAVWMNPVRSLIRPVREGLFAGTLDIAKIPSLSDRIKFRISVGLGVWSEGDHRDWNAIRAWAQSLQPLLVK